MIILIELAIEAKNGFGDWLIHDCYRIERAPEVYFNDRYAVFFQFFTIFADSRSAPFATTTGALSSLCRWRSAIAMWLGLAMVSVAVLTWSTSGAGFCLVPVTKVEIS